MPITETRAELCGNPKTQGPARVKLLWAGTLTHEIVPLAAKYMESHGRFMRFVLRFHDGDLQTARDYARTTSGVAAITANPIRPTGS